MSWPGRTHFAAATADTALGTRVTICGWVDRYRCATCFMWSRSQNPCPGPVDAFKGMKYLKIANSGVPYTVYQVNE